LINFLRGEADTIKGNISLADKNLKDARALMDSEADKLKSMDEYITKITDSIISLAQKEKESILEKARINADKMIEDATKESEIRIDQARKKLSEDILDIAVKIAGDRLQEILGREDNEKIIDRFTSELNSSDFAL